MSVLRVGAGGEGLPAQAGQDGAGASAAWAAGRSAFSLASAIFTVMVPARIEQALVGRALPGKVMSVSDAHRRPERRRSRAWVGSVEAAEVELIAAVERAKE